MDVWPLPAPDRIDDPLRRDLGALIGSVGSPAFEDILFRCAREITGCEHLTAFALDEAGQPKLLLAMNAGDPHVARITGEAYVSRYWHMDPANRLCEAPPALAGVLARARDEEVRLAPFRRRCYNANDWSRSGAKLFDRLSIIRRFQREIVKISFHRAQKAGPFGDREVAGVAASSDVLVALVLRHGRSAAPAANADSLAFYVRAVAAQVPSLSRREIEVCAGIVLGMTSEGIASTLGVSLNTVRTYRKRAYARLCISSQNELMKLVMPHPFVD